MPKVNRPTETRDFVRAFESHGLDLHQGPGDQVIGDCPFCDNGTGKFYANKLSGVWNCFHCSPEGGNLLVFFRRLWEDLYKISHDYELLAKSRGLLSKATCGKWGTVMGPTGVWLVPGFNAENNVAQLYRYIKPTGANKYRLLASLSPDDKDDTEGKLYKHGMHKIIDSKRHYRVFICEGAWDGMLLSELVDLDKCDVIAVPGCNVFHKSWASYFGGREVIFLYDNDHPDRNGNIPALTGIQRAASLMKNSGSAPKSIKYLKWGHKDDFYNPDLPAGFDIGDYLRKASSYDGRRRLWTTLSKDITEIPNEWLEDYHTGGVRIYPSTCTSWKELQTYWRLSGMYWPNPGEELDYALIVILAVILSTATQGDQIWLKLIAPPSSGKSVLCEAISTAREYVKPKSITTNLFSGYRTGSDDSEDNSLIADLNGKTLVFKDVDPLIQTGRIDSLLGQFRDAYDGACRTHYGNRMGKDYEGYRFTVIIGGTNNLANIDSSEKGERFINCIAIESVEADTEKDIAYMVGLRSVREGRTLVDGVAESLLTPEMIEARSRTGGFVEHIRQNAKQLVDAVEEDESKIRLISAWGEFTSFMRAKEPLDKGKGYREVEAQRELCYRLVAQFCRLGLHVAAVMGKKSYDREVMAVVRKSVLDTCKGHTLNLVKELYSREDGLETGALAIVFSKGDNDIKKFLEFAQKIGIVETRRVNRVSRSFRWHLTGRIRGLCQLILD